MKIATKPELLPEWLLKDYEKLLSFLSPSGVVDLAELRESYIKLKNIIDELPIETKLFEIYKIDAASLHKIYGDVFSGLAHACEALVGYWAFQHAHKYRCFFEGFVSAFQDGNYLLSFSCARALMEETSHFHYFFSRLQPLYEKTINLLHNERRRLSRGVQPPETWTKEFISCQLEILQKTNNAIQGSDFDWRTWLASTLDNHGLSEMDIENIVNSHNNPRKTHINKCNEYLQKKKNIKAQYYYDLFSEMVHPNFGSSSLIIKTREKIDDMRGNVVISSSPRNNEAAAWFLELSSKPLSKLFDIESDAIIQSQSILIFYQKLAVNSNPVKHTFH